MSEEIYWLFQEREHALRLIAAIASSEDKQRQAFLDGNVTPNILDSMKPLNEGLLLSLYDSDKSRETRKIVTTDIGSPVAVLCAACNAAKALTRSVSLLRTTLADAGLPQPILALLKHTDISVRKAATDVVINLNPEFSPMRSVSETRDRDTHVLTTTKASRRDWLDQHSQ